jgi:hypothetical protein
MCTSPSGKVVDDHAVRRRDNEHANAKVDRHVCDDTCAHTVDIGYVHTLTEAGGPCRADCPHPDHRQMPGRTPTAAQQKAAEVYDALVEMQARPTTSNDDATTLIEAASFVAAVRDGRMTTP